jgi:hypothetical protein
MLERTRKTARKRADEKRMAKVEGRKEGSRERDLDEGEKVSGMLRSKKYGKNRFTLTMGERKESNENSEVRDAEADGSLLLRYSEQQLCHRDKNRGGLAEKLKTLMTPSRTARRKVGELHTRGERMGGKLGS